MHTQTLNMSWSEVDKVWTESARGQLTPNCRQTPRAHKPQLQSQLWPVRCKDLHWQVVYCQRHVGCENCWSVTTLPSLVELSLWLGLVRAGVLSAIGGELGTCKLWPYSQSVNFAPGHIQGLAVCTLQHSQTLKKLTFGLAFWEIRSLILWHTHPWIEKLYLHLLMTAETQGNCMVLE